MPLMHRSFYFLLFPSSRPQRKADRAKRQPGDRGAPGKEVQKERRLQYMDDHQERQNNTQEHQGHTESKKEAGRVQHGFLNR